MANDDFAPKEYSRLKQKGFFEFVRGFLPFVANRQKEQKPLAGRIQSQLQRDAHRMLLQLQELKAILRKELDNHRDEQLWLSFEAVINPLLREYRLIERQLIHPSDETFKIQNVNSWIDRAKLWVSLCSKPTNREEMVQAVVAHTLQILDQMIDRDLKTLSDYKNHELQLLGLSEEAYSVVRHRLDQDLTPFVNGLLTLKQDIPIDMELGTLVTWKTHADEERNKLFNAALQMMDSIINKAIPFAPHEEEQEHLKDLIHRISLLENEMQVLQVQFQNSDLEDPLQKEMLVSALLFFEEQAHQIHHELRLTPELVERVQLLLQQFSQLRDDLSQSQ